MKMLYSFFGVLLSCLILSGCKDEKKDQLIIGTSLDNPPFSFSKNGEATGFEIELVKEIAKRLNVKPVIKDMDFSALIGALQSHSVDIAIASISKTPEREKAVEFIGPYFITMPTLVWGTDSKEPPFTSQGLIGSQLGSIYEPIAKSLAGEHDMKPFSMDKVTALVQEVKNRRISLFITGEFEAKAIIAAQKTLSSKTLTDYKESYSIGLPKGSDKKDKIAKVLAEIQNDGTLEKLKQHWLT